MAATQELLLGEGAGGAATYIEDVFSTYVYTGTAANLTITNNIDLSTKGGMVWLKVRSGTTGDHEVFDTVRGATNRVIPNATNGQITTANTLTAFNADGFSIGNYSEINGSGNGMASWTFREQPKFFDVVTYTGTGSATTIAHNLGSVPGCIMIKQTSASGQNWRVWHTSLDTTSGDQALSLNLTSSAGGGSGSYWNYTLPTSSVFTVGTDDSVNASGQTYVAYVFATNAGGFGLTGTDNVITCGSYTGAAFAPFPNINLGYEPQWLLIKNITSNASWVMVDSMRGFTTQLVDPFLYPNLTNAETNSNGSPNPTSTGFTFGNADTGTTDAGQTYIYIAIRRGPMRVPTDGTTVFNAVTTTGANEVLSTLEAGDLGIFKKATDATTYPDWLWGDRLRGFTSSTSQLLSSNSTSTETTWSGSGDGVTAYYGNIGSSAGNGKIKGGGAGSANTPTLYSVKRAPSFFDEVCYTGTGTATTVTHNLGITPQLIFIKGRSVGTNWNTYSASSTPNKRLFLDSDWGYDDPNTTDASIFNNTAPTSSVFSVGGSANGSGYTFVAYLFATCPGVSKVGSYTGTGTLTTIDCGFVGGARFVLIKRTDTTGAWYVWDTARGMISGTDPSLRLNSTAVQSNANSVYTITTGFQLLASPAVGVNTNGGSYIYLAIA